MTLATALDPFAWEVAWTSDVARWPRWIGLPLEIVMQTGTRWVVVVVAAFLIGVGRVRLGLTVAVAGAVAWIASRLLKDVFDRPRPTIGDIGRPLREAADGFAFPSSHATIATALVVTVVAGLWGARRARQIAVGVGALVVVATCLSRLYVGAHWPLDVLAGTVLGLAASALVLAAVEAALRVWETRQLT